MLQKFKMKRAREEENSNNGITLPMIVVDAFTSKPFAGYVNFFFFLSIILLQNNEKNKNNTIIQ